MKPTRKSFLLLLLICALMVTGCDAINPPVGVTALPSERPTVTPGGMLLMALPTEAPVTPAPTPSAVLPVDGPANILTAMPAEQSDIECPAPGNPAPPAAPATYNLYPGVINEFLSSGGSVPFLYSILQTWGAASDDVGMATDAYDLTGDGVYEVLVSLSDPFNAEVAPQPGQLFAFGCYQGNYRLLYASDYGPGYGLPSLLYVGDMNADGGPEAVYFQQRCQSGSCVQAAQVISWSAPNDGFLTLNVDTVGAADGRFSISDLDGDRIMEIMIQGGGISASVTSGPPRTSTTVWDWNGTNYVRALTQLDPPLFRIHMVHDADLALASGEGLEAIRLYREALENPRLGTWQVPNEQLMLRGYALYKLMVAYAFMEEDGAALDVHSTLMDEHPAQYPSHVYAQVGDMFWQVFQSTHNLHTACLAAAEVVSTNPQTVLFLNSYGPANRTYQIPDICPF